MTNSRAFSASFMPKLLIVALSALFISGCDKAAEVPVSEREAAQSESNLNKLHNLKNAQHSLRLKVDGKRSYKLGESVSFEVTPEQSGKLWVIYVDGSGEKTQLLPNPLVSDNTVRAEKTITIPDQRWSLTASEPLGKGGIAFIQTSGNMTLEKVLAKSQAAENSGVALYDEDAAHWGVVVRELTIVK